MNAGTMELRNLLHLLLAGLFTLHPTRAAVTDAASRAKPGSSTFSSASQEYDYDIFVIGGGSGGLACAKEAGSLGARVGLCDFVRPSPRGTKWGLGGTCVNVGCIPKKLMHRAGQLRHVLESEANAYGYALDAPLSEGLGGDGIPHEWPRLVTAVQNHIKSLNFGYRAALSKAGVEYVNARGSLAGGHDIVLEAVDGSAPRTVSARHIVIAVGGRPLIPPSFEGAAELAITSDDLFSLVTPPGKTLVVGGGYVALECAGFLAGLGYETTVMVRSVPLRGFDRECADLVLDSVGREGATVLRDATPVRAYRTADGRIGVQWRQRSRSVDEAKEGGEERVVESVTDEVFDTVLVATGRRPEIGALGLESVGLDPKTDGKLATCASTTEVQYIHAIGDVASEAPHGRPELTPVAIREGVLLARRLCGPGGQDGPDAGTTSAQARDGEWRRSALAREAIPTAVFSPTEYACIGLSEEEARERIGDEHLEVYLLEYVPLEWSVVPARAETPCFLKLLCDTSDDERIVGAHMVGEHASEIVPGLALAMRLGARKADLDETIGVHPTCSEELMALRVTRRSGEDPSKGGC